MEKEKEVKRGARQWAEVSINAWNGCENGGCLYCWAEAMAIRAGRMKAENWKCVVARPKDLQKKIPKYDGLVMFPSTSDITPINLSEAIQLLKKILMAGNKVLVVSKPRYDCISKICNTFTEYKDMILFRFTIGSIDDNILSYWEKSAPSSTERLNCLKLAYDLGYQTSISAEPLLQQNIDDLIDTLSPYVTETIWIGKANHLLYRLRMNGHGDPQTIERAKELMNWQDDPSFIQYLFEKYFQNPMIRFKESYLEEFENRGWI